MGGNPNHISSYVEVMCRLYDDNNFESFVDKLDSKNEISEALDFELKKLRNSLNNYQEKETDIEIIEDPEWSKVVEQAKAVINCWGKVKDLRWRLE